MMLRNTARQTVLARKTFRAVTFWARFMGLMGKSHFPASYDALIFDNCNSIHCFFMRMTIDVIFTDKENKAVKCIGNLKPWRLAFGGFRGCRCIELPCGSIEKSGTLPGDQLSFETTEEKETL